MAESLEARARSAVNIEILARYINGSIATNPGFRPREFDSAYGVEPEEYPDIMEIAAEALVPAVLDALATRAPILSIQDWIERESKARGGKGQLAAALLGIPEKGRTNNPRYRALLRALQRSAKATKTGRKEEHKGLGEEYRRLIGDFTDGALGNPYAPPSVRARATLEKCRAQLSIRGDWRISKRVYDYAWKGTDMEPSAKRPPEERARGALIFERVWSYPASFVDEVMETIGATWASAALEVMDMDDARQLLILDKCYGYSLIIELPQE